MRKREPKPLILTGHGVYLGVNHGALVVRNGFTHYPQKREERRLFPGDRKLPNSQVHKSALLKLDGALQELEHPIADVETLRLIEGRAALAYFGCWQSIPLKWKGVGRHPIPLEWMAVGQRESLLTGVNRNANHPVNAILNYAYGVLESQVRIATVASGLDPAIGYLHACRPGRSALVYDLMEPLRPMVDRLILQFIRSHTFTPADFPIMPKGVCRLHPQLAKTVAGLAVSEERVKAGLDEFTGCLKKIP